MRSSYPVVQHTNGISAIQRVVVLLALLATCLLFIPFKPVMPSSGLDPSWRFAINTAVEKGYVFGRDLIFTFGPLGSVSSAAFSPATDLMMMITSTLYAGAFAISIHLSAVGRRQWWAIVLPFLVCIFFMRDVYFLAMPFFLLLAVLRTTQPIGSANRLELTPAVVIGLAVATVAMGIGPIVKGSFSGVVLAVGGLTCLVLFIANVRAALGFVALALIGTAGSWVLSGQALGDLPQFFIAQGPIISGYTNAMSLGGDAKAVGYFLLGAAIVFGIFSFALWRAFGRRAVFAIVAMAFVLFISFKAGFVRQDRHIFISMGVLLLFAYGTALYARPAMVAGAWAVVALVWYLVGSSAIDIDGRFFSDNISNSWKKTFQGLKTRLIEPEKLARDYERAVERIRAEDPLPVVAGTVDIYPTELSAIFANGLNWSGRPIPQSYSVYDPLLDAKNVAHLKSDRAPDTVFFTLASIDGRLPVMDDSGSVLELLAGYSVYGISQPYLMLNKHSGARGAELDTSNRIDMRRAFGESIELDSRQPLWMQLNIRQTVLGKTVSTLFRLPQVQLEVTLDSGAVFRKRIIPKIAEVGFIVSPYLESNSDFVNLAAGIDAGPKVKSVRIYTEGKGLWQDSIDVSITPIKIIPQRSARELVVDSAVKPSIELEAFRAAGSAQCTIDGANGAKYQPGVSIGELNGVVLLRGWIAPNREDDENRMQVWAIVERSGSPTRHYMAKKESRPDVAAALKRPSMVDAGFTLALDFRDEPGIKNIALVSIVGGNVYECAGLTISVQSR